MQTTSFNKTVKQWNEREKPKITFKLAHELDRTSDFQIALEVLSSHDVITFQSFKRLCKTKRVRRQPARICRYLYDQRIIHLSHFIPPRLCGTPRGESIARRDESFEDKNLNHCIIELTAHGRKLFDRPPLFQIMKRV
jgi:hypothetical protein